MLQSLTAGSSGVRTYAGAMTVTGSNIANVNTTAYKTNRVSFQDMLATNLKQSDRKLGTGVTLGDVQAIHNQGTIDDSELSTDMAIEGDGLFVLKNKFGKEFYTRAGQFQYDKDGFLVTPDKMFVQVKDVDEVTGASIGSPKKVNVLTQNLPPKPTGNGELEGTGVVFKGNLNMNAAVPNKSFEKDDVRPAMYNYSTTVKVYDVAGNERTMNLAFRKLEDIPAKTDPQTGVTTPAKRDRWAYYLLADRDDLENPNGAGAVQAVGGGFLQFDNVGKLLSVSKGEFKSEPPAQPGGQPGPIRLTELPPNPEEPRPKFTVEFKGVGASQDLGLDLGTGSNPADLNDERTGLEGITQFAAPNKTVTIEADGNKAGELEDIRIETDGTIKGLFNSGQIKSIGRIQIAKFKGVGNLERQGNNLFVATNESGNASINDPGAGGTGTVRSKAVERSNVDLATEFVKMIENQRAFQANAKTVSTSDEIIADLIQMKR